MGMSDVVERGRDCEAVGQAGGRECLAAGRAGAGLAGIVRL